MTVSSIWYNLSNSIWNCPFESCSIRRRSSDLAATERCLAVTADADNEAVGQAALRGRIVRAKPVTGGRIPPACLAGRARHGVGPVRGFVSRLVEDEPCVRLRRHRATGTLLGALSAAWSPIQTRQRRQRSPAASELVRLQQLEDRQCRSPGIALPDRGP